MIKEEKGVYRYLYAATTMRARVMGFLTFERENIGLQYLECVFLFNFNFELQDAEKAFGLN